MVSSGKRSAMRVFGVLGVAAAIVVGANYAPESAELNVPPSPGASGEGSRSALIDRISMVCPGPEQQGLADAAVDEVEQRVEVAAMSAPQQVVEAALVGADYRGSATDLDQGSMAVTPLGSPSSTTADPVSVDERGVAAGISLTGAEGAVALALAGLAPGVSATQLYAGADDQQLGLALTPCVTASEEAWLIAGGGDSGRSERLVVMNPGQSAIAASVQVWGATGDPKGEVGDVGIVLEPGEREVVLIDALAPAEAAPVVHVVSTGGPISAYLGDRALDGTTEVGWESAAPVASPARSHVIPSIVIPARTQAAASVRVAVTGPNPAVVEVAAWGPGGAAALAQGVTVVPGERSADISVSDLPPGTYALGVTSDEDIVASASVGSKPDASGRRDFSWAASAPAVLTLAGSALPQPKQGAEVRYALDLFAPQGGSATVFTLNEAGVVTSVDVDLAPQMFNTSTLLDATGVWVVPGGDEVFASVRGQSDVTPAQRATSDEGATTAAPATESPATAAPPTDEAGAAVSVTSVFALSNLGLVRSVAAIAPELP